MGNRFVQACLYHVEEHEQELHAERLSVKRKLTANEQQRNALRQLASPPRKVTSLDCINI